MSVDMYLNLEFTGTHGVHAALLRDCLRVGRNQRFFELLGAREPPSQQNRQLIHRGAQDVSAGVFFQYFAAVYDGALGQMSDIDHAWRTPQEPDARRMHGAETRIVRGVTFVSDPTYNSSSCASREEFSACIEEAEVSDAHTDLVLYLAEKVNQYYEHDLICLLALSAGSTRTKPPTASQPTDP